MESQGELEQKPVEEVSQNEETPVEKPKKHVSPVIICAIIAASLLFILACCLIVMKVTENNSSTEKKKEGSSSEEEKKEEPEPEHEEDLTEEERKEEDKKKEEIRKDIVPVTLNDGVNDVKIQAIFKALETKINEAKIDLSGLSVYKDYRLPYSYKKGYATMIAGAYAVETKYNIDVDYDERMDTEKVIHGLIDSVMVEAGFTTSNNLDNVEFIGGYYHAFLGSDGYFCEYQDQDNFLVCGNTNWLSKAQQDLVTALTDAMYENPNEERNEEEIIIVYADTDRIKDSEVKPYQRLEAGTLTGWLWFYRKSPNDKWVFVGGGNAPPRCDESFYATEDSRNAYKDADPMCQE